MWPVERVAAWMGECGVTTRNKAEEAGEAGRSKVWSGYQLLAGRWPALICALRGQRQHKLQTQRHTLCDRLCEHVRWETHACGHTAPTLHTNPPTCDPRCCRRTRSVSSGCPAQMPTMPLSAPAMKSLVACPISCTSRHKAVGRWRLEVPGVASCEVC